MPRWRWMRRSSEDTPKPSFSPLTPGPPTHDHAELKCSISDICSDVVINTRKEGQMPQ